VSGDAIVLASRVAVGARVLLAGDRGPDGAASRVVSELSSLLVDVADVTRVPSDLTAVHDLDSRERFSLVLLSVCRCIECTVVAWTLYARHVDADGILAVPDTNPMAAWVGWWQGHGPKTRDYGLATRAALARMELLDGVHSRWRLELDHYDQAAELGGVMLFRRRF
jgi:hypothetical protein